MTTLISGVREDASTVSMPAPSIWLVKDGEPLPVDQSPHLLRTGNLAKRLADDGFRVTWWTSHFDHGRKQARPHPPGPLYVRPNYALFLLDGPPYKRNISLARIRNNLACASEFTKMAPEMTRPDLIIASYPSAEQCNAARRYAKRIGVPFIVDMRDPWPDNVPGFFTRLTRPALLPGLMYYRRMLRSIVADADGIVAMSEAMLAWALRYSCRARRPQDQVIRIGGDLPATPRSIDVPAEFTARAPLVCAFLSSGGVSSDAMSIVEAARILQSEGESRVRFVLTGGGLPNADWRLAARNVRSVTCLNWLDHNEIEMLLKSAHVGLIQITGDVSRFWLGNKFFDYLSSFLATINNVSGEAACIVNERQLGVNIPPKDPLALAVAIRSLLADPARVRSYMENARSAFMLHFDRRLIHDQFLTYLQRHLTRGWSR